MRGCGGADALADLGRELIDHDGHVATGLTVLDDTKEIPFHRAMTDWGDNDLDSSDSESDGGLYTMAKSYKPKASQAQAPRLFDSRVFDDAPADVYGSLLYGNADEYAVDAQATRMRALNAPPGVLRGGRTSSFAGPGRSSVV